MSSSILTVGILCVNLSCKHVLVLQLEENKGYTGVARTASDGPTVMACFVVVHHPQVPKTYLSKNSYSFIRSFGVRLKSVADRVSSLKIIYAWNVLGLPNGCRLHGKGKSLYAI